MRKKISILFGISFILVFNSVAQYGEIHYQSYNNRFSNWSPVDDSLTIAFSPDWANYLGSMVKFSLVTGKWKAKGNDTLVERYNYSNFAELKNGLTIGLTPNYRMHISNGFNTILKDTIALSNQIFASDSCFLVPQSSSSSSPLKYSKNGIDWYFSSFDISVLSSLSIKHVHRKRVLVSGFLLSQSYDGGITFKTIPFNKLPFSPYNANNVTDFVLVGDSGIYLRATQAAYTNNAGQSWQYFSSPSNVSKIKLIKGDSLLGLPVLGSDTLKLSTDAGATWAPWINSPAGNVPITEVFNYGDTLFLVDANKVVWRTKNAGNNFDKIVYPKVSSLVNYQSSWKQVSARDSIVVAIGDGGSMIVSTDYGNSFEGRGQQSNVWLRLSILKNGHFLATSNAGTFLSKDLGKSWLTAINSTNIDHILTADSTEKIIAIDNWVSTNGGNTFKKISSGQFEPSLTVLPSGRLLNIFHNGGSFYWVREYDTLGNFTTLDSTYGPYQSKYLMKVEMLSDQYGWAFYNTYSDMEVYFTSDGWQSKRLMSTFNVQGSNFVYSPMDVHVYSATELFFAQGYNEKQLFHSIDSGKTWSVVDKLPFTSSYYYQNYTSGTFRDTDSWWVTNQHYVIRRNPRKWDPKTFIKSGLSIESFERRITYDAFPNPTSGIVNLPKNFQGIVHVVNSSGQYVAMLKSEDGNINLEKYPEGLYFLIFEDSGIEFASKIKLIK